MRPARGRVLVKRVETEETLPGGKIIFTAAAQEAWAQWQVEVIEVGLPSICEKPKKCTRSHDVFSRAVGFDGPIAFHRTDHRLTPGAWCIIRHRSLVPVGNEDARFLCNQEDILGIFQEGGAVITQTGQSHILSETARNRIYERNVALRAKHLYGEQEPVSGVTFGLPHGDDNG